MRNGWTPYTHPSRLHTGITLPRAGLQGGSVGCGDPLRLSHSHAFWPRNDDEEPGMKSAMNSCRIHLEWDPDIQAFVLSSIPKSPTTLQWALDACVEAATTARSRSSRSWR